MITLFLLFFLNFTRPIFAENTATPSATTVPSPTILTPTLTFIPTPTPIINPTSDIYINELMPYQVDQWIEIINKKDKEDVELINWKIQNKSSNTKLILNLRISANSFAVFNFGRFFDMEGDDTVYLLNQDNQIVDKKSYSKGKFLPQKTWSLINNSWCLAEETYNKSNGNSCYIESTPTIKPTSTPTPNNLLTPTPIPTNRNLYKPDESATASAIFTPPEESGFYITPIPTITTTPISSNLILGETATTRKNYLPLVFIVSGGSLLISPKLINKFNKK